MSVKPTPTVYQPGPSRCNDPIRSEHPIGHPAHNAPRMYYLGTGTRFPRVQRTGCHDTRDPRFWPVFAGFGWCGEMAEFGLTKAEALKVSDHLPVWAAFSVYEGEGVGPVATRPGTPTR